jgi:hypothetical protein
MDLITAIPTKYNGYEFRSRLEARWAVFFDAFGVRYEYEAEGLDLTEVAKKYPPPTKLTKKQLWYLPDFWLPDYDAYVEIKPEYVLSAADADRCWLATIGLKDKTMLILTGAPGIDCTACHLIEKGKMDAGTLAEGRYCDRLWIVDRTTLEEAPINCNNCWSPRCGEGNTWPGRGLDQAYIAARQAKF